MELLFVAGDQLAPNAPALRGADPAHALVVMAEVEAEARRVPSHKQRLALFFAAMRHWAEARRAEGWRVRYQRLDDPGAAPSLPAFLARCIEEERPSRVVFAELGRLSLEEELRAVCAAAGVPLRVVEDDHFLCSRRDVRAWARGRSVYRMEHFYRWQRRRLNVLMDEDEPSGGRWNFDADNRKAFREDPGPIEGPIGFEPDALTREVLALVAVRFPDHPGTLDGFDWPVTPEQATQALDDFVAHRLAHFGTYQDAMWAGRPYLYHSRLSAALNLKLLDPRRVVDAAEEAWRLGRVPLNAAEGFVRQVIGWREYVRGLYTLHAEAYLEGNALDAQHDLPDFYWTGTTHMACVADVVRQLLATAYAHHIQRLMVTGLFALLYGADPRQVHAWYMALYADSVEWVTLPNTVGMSLYADGGLTASKPYIASGKYVARMSNYCRGCRYAPDEAAGARACPFTTLYWAFLDRHADRFRGHPRLGQQVRHLERKRPDELEAIRERAAWVYRAAREGRL